MIQVSNISKHFAGQVLFENITFNIDKGDRIGLVGRNGSGKSTLFQMILGTQTFDTGKITYPKGYKIGALEQHIRFTYKTVIEECVQVLVGDKKFETFRAEKILSGLGFSDEDFRKDPASFSGGYQIRINLCKCLLQEPDLLLLDEPTNYLDIVSLRWLRTFLRTFQGEVVIITHDREFMDSVTTHTMGIYRSSLKKVKGSTEKFYSQMLLEDEIYEKTRLNQEKKREHLELFIERFGAKASKATQAQSKMKQLEKMSVLEKLGSEAAMGLKFQYKECPGKVIMEAKNLAFSYSGREQDFLFKNVSFSIGRHDRIGIIGKNGKGKSTLLNLLARELDPVAGEVSSHPSMIQGHLGQTNIDRLHGDHSIIQEIATVAGGLGNTAIRNICGSLMFEGELAEKKISVLSGGERSRVLLGKILAKQTNLLLLDEPTNHLDMESIEILKEEIKSFPGAVVIVTHSEALLNEVVDKLVVFGRGGAEYFLGNYQEFLEKIGWEEDVSESRVVAGGAKSILTKKEIHARRQEIIKERARVCNPLKLQLSELEGQVLQIEEELEVVNKALSSATLNNNNAEILNASRRIGELEESISLYFEKMELIEVELNQKSRIFDDQLKSLN